MTKKATRKAAADTAASGAEETAPRVVRYVVNWPYSAGEHHDIVDAEVVHEHEGEEDVLRLKLLDPPQGVEEDVKRVSRSDRQEPGTWHEPSAEASAEPAAEEAESGSPEA